MLLLGRAEGAGRKDVVSACWQGVLEHLEHSSSLRSDTAKEMLGCQRECAECAC